MRVTDPEKHQAKKQMILEAAKALLKALGRMLGTNYNCAETL